MCAVKRVKAAEIFPIISEILQQGGKAWITVTGMSMYPFLREDKDSVELAPVNYENVKRGDIVLIRRYCGDYVLHRVLRKQNGTFHIIGDAQQWIEGPLQKEQLIAVVTAIRRDGKKINCDNLVWKLLSMLWLELIPLRHLFFRGIRGIGRIIFRGKKACS